MSAASPAHLASLASAGASPSEEPPTKLLDRRGSTGGPLQDQNP